MRRSRPARAAAPSRPVPSRRRRAVLAVSAALLLAGCGTGAPGVAAQVGDDRISDADVDEFAQVLCALNRVPSDTNGATPTRQVRFNALQILLGNELARGVADLDQVDRSQVKGAVDQASATRDLVPSRLQDTFDQVVEEYAEAQYAIIALGRQSLEDQGQDPDAITEDAAYTEGDRLRQQYAQEVGVEVDPRFGSMEKGVLRPGDGSLSVPVSDFAVKASSQNGDTSLAGELPASQTCG